MPIRDLLIEQASSAILEPISQQITYSVLSRLGLGDAFGENIYITNDYTKPSLTSGDDHNALISRDRCDVAMTVAWNPVDTKWNVDTFRFTQAYGVSGTVDHDLIPVFVDPVAGVQLTEHQLPCSISLVFSLQFKNRESAFSTLSVINNISNRDSVINEHALSYSYPISADMLDCLNQIYKMRQASVGLDFWTYLRRYSQYTVQYLQKRTGTQTELVIKRQNLRAMGVLEYSQSAPTVQEQDRGIDRFVVEFTYTAQFARPDVLRLNFPVVICNQPVPSQMIRYDPNDAIAALQGSLQERSISSYLRSQGIPIQTVVRRPTYDDFRPPQHPVGAAGFAAFFCVALYLDDAPTTTIDLLNLGGGLKLHDTVVALMKQHGEDVFSTTGLFNVTVYCNGVPVDISRLSIDDNLILTLAMSYQVRRYHLVISEATDLGQLDGKWYPTLIANRTFFPITVIANLQRLIAKKYCYIDRDNALLRLVNQQIRHLMIDTQIEALITAGHLTHYAYSFATTAEQFVEYLITTISPVSQRTVYDEYVQMCVMAGLISESQLATGHLILANGFPVLPRNLRGVLSSFNLPLRIMSDTVVMSRRTTS